MTESELAVMTNGLAAAPIPPERVLRLTAGAVMVPPAVAMPPVPAVVRFKELVALRLDCSDMFPLAAVVRFST